MAAGGALVGELGSVLLAQGGAAAWADPANPQPLLLVPAAAAGVRLVDLLFSVSGDVPGCVLLDWRAPSAASSMSCPTARWPLLPKRSVPSIFWSMPQASCIMAR